MRGPTVANPLVGRSSAITSVVTPQAVLLEFRTAGIGSRVLAKSIDFAIQILAAIVLLFFVGTAGLGGSGGFVVVTIGLFLIVFAYPASEAFMNGQTLGKRALSIRVITADGGPIRLRHAVVRSLIGLLELIALPPGGPVALISALLTRRSQRVGDIVAETLVVRDKREVTTPVHLTPPVGTESISATLDTTRLSHPQYGVLRQFVLRQWELDPEARHRVAWDLCRHLHEIGLTMPATVDPVSFVGAVVAAHQRRFSGGFSAMPPPPGASAYAAPPPTGVAAAMAPPSPRS